MFQVIIRVGETTREFAVSDELMRKPPVGHLSDMAQDFMLNRVAKEFTDAYIAETRRTQSGS